MAEIQASEKKGRLGSLPRDWKEKAILREDLYPHFSKLPIGFYDVTCQEGEKPRVIVVTPVEIWEIRGKEALNILSSPPPN